MSTSSQVTLVSIRVQAQQRADMENSEFLTVTEWNQNVTNSRKELYDLMIAAYGNDYEVATPYSFTTDGQNDAYALPSDFYKLLGVDLAISGVSNTYTTLKQFNFTERNNYSVANVPAIYGRTNLKYRVRGNKLWFNQIPSGGQGVRLFYVPEPTNLQFIFSGNLTESSSDIPLTDTSFLSVGMTISNDNFPAGTVISSIVDDVSITLSNVSTATASSSVIYAWSDLTVIDGISGWEEYIIIDCAIKARIKEESDVNDLYATKKDMKDRLILMANDRDIGTPSTVVDSLSVDCDYYGANGGGYGWQ